MVPGCQNNTFSCSSILEHQKKVTILLIVIQAVALTAIALGIYFKIPLASYIAASIATLDGLLLAVVKLNHPTVTIFTAGDNEYSISYEERQRIDGAKKEFKNEPAVQLEVQTLDGIIFCTLNNGNEKFFDNKESAEQYLNAINFSHR